MRQVFTYILLRGIVDKNIDFLEPEIKVKIWESVKIVPEGKYLPCIPVYMLLDCSLAPYLIIKSIDERKVEGDLRRF